MSVTPLMKAFVLVEPGATTMELAEVPVPSIDADELLVRVHAVGVGIHDSYFLPADAVYPYPIGIEAAGVVERVGAGVTGLRPGDRIAFVSSMQPKGGTWAQCVTVKAGALILPIPEDLGFADAAAVPVAGNTLLKAFRALDSGEGQHPIYCRRLGRDRHARHPDCPRARAARGGIGVRRKSGLHDLAGRGNILGLS